MLRETERHENCTVIVCIDDITGDVDISWYDNEDPPKLIYTSLGEET